MFKSLWFLIKLAVLVAAIGWLAKNPGTVEIRWLDYYIQSSVAVLLGAVLILIVLWSFWYRLWRTIVTFPQALRKYRQIKSGRKGVRALTLGLSAIAAGDTKTARVQTLRVEKLLPESDAIAKLLKAHIARLRGDTKAARREYMALLEDKDSAFLGVRGLLSQAMRTHDLAEALKLARKAYDMHPKQPWILQTLYELELESQNWDSASTALHKLVRYKGLDNDQAKCDQAAIQLVKSEHATVTGQSGDALRHAKKAFDLNNSFIPAGLNLARLYIQDKSERQAKRVVQKAWAQNPHPDYIPLWTSLAPKNKSQDPVRFMQWIKTLTDHNPDHVESHLAIAQIALDSVLWGEARKALNNAENIRPTKRIYRLYARLEEREGQSRTDIDNYLAKAEHAADDPAWICMETGRVYGKWLPFADPHHSFNTIIWDYPDRVQPKALGGISNTHWNEDSTLLEPSAAA